MEWKFKLANLIQLIGFKMKFYNEINKIYVIG